MRNITSSEVMTGVAAIAATLDPQVDFYLNEIRLHLSAAGGAGILTISVDSAAGAAYDVVLIPQDMTVVVDLLYIPDLKLHFAAGDKIKVVWANANARTYGVEFVYTKIAEVF